jgi:hypothetical protein
MHVLRDIVIDSVLCIVAPNVKDFHFDAEEMQNLQDGQHWIIVHDDQNG